MAAETTSNTGINENFICGVVEGFYGRPWTPDQRRDLFIKMKKWGLNTYMYAPKDDFKHRAYWRDLYTVEEAEHLTSLIQAAKENSIDFCYALSPGLDIAYSSAKEVSCLKRKLEQVSQFGCTSFALLFDDIETEISETDKEVFQSFGHAQVSVTNEIYQHLSSPKFFFCPTEYCAARAVPSVVASEYLNTIGSKLLPGIEIMWTGPRVISKQITVESIQELTEVLHRPPVIWDNIHANDYDQKRLFLGPYNGRSTDLIPHLHGVLTNPNSEYEMNFIPIHTFAQWSKCDADGKTDHSDTVSADIKLEAESETGSLEDIPSHIGPTAYHPKRALKLAINDWLPEFYRAKNAFGHVVSAPFVPAPIPGCSSQLLNPCIALPSASLSTSSIGTVPNRLAGDDSAFQPLSTELVNSLVSSTISINSLPKVETPLAEPMDCIPSFTENPKVSPERTEPESTIPSSSITESAMPENSTSESTLPESPETRTLENQSAMPEAAVGESTMPENGITESIITEGGNQESSMPGSIESEMKVETEPSERMQTEGDISGLPNDESKHISYEDISILVDLFYLPFEHGRQGVVIAQEFQWLKAHGHLVSEHRGKKEAENHEVQEWYTRASKFDQIAHNIGKLLVKLNYCQNRSLLYDLYPYVWDIKGVISLLNSYIKWIALGRFPINVTSFMCPAFTWFSKGYKEAFMSGDQEPWLFRGGLTSELQRLLPLESVSDLFLYKTPDSPSSKIYTIRPYLASDETSVYSVCQKTYDDSGENTKAFADHPQLLGDKYVGGYLCLSPEYCFVVDDESGVCGYALAALDARQFYRKLEMAYLPEMCAKYPHPEKNLGELLTPVEKMILSFHQSQGRMVVPDEVYKNHSSILRMNLLSTISDLSLPKRLLTCVLSSLKANGSHGVFTEVPVSDKSILDFYSKLGFIEIPGSRLAGMENTCYLGRAF